MNEYVWETCEELDKKIADRGKTNKKKTLHFRRRSFGLAMPVLAR